MWTYCDFAWTYCAQWNLSWRSYETFGNVMKWKVNYMDYFDCLFCYGHIRQGFDICDQESANVRRNSDNKSAYLSHSTKVRHIGKGPGKIRQLFDKVSTNIRNIFDQKAPMRFHVRFIVWRNLGSLVIIWEHARFWILNATLMTYATSLLRTCYAILHCYLASPLGVPMSLNGRYMKSNTYR